MLYLTVLPANALSSSGVIVTFKMLETSYIPSSVSEYDIVLSPPAKIAAAPSFLGTTLNSAAVSLAIST